MTQFVQNELSIQQPVDYSAIVVECIFFSVALRPNAGHGLLILDVSR